MVTTSNRFRPSRRDRYMSGQVVLALAAAVVQFEPGMDLALLVFPGPTPVPIRRLDRIRCIRA